MSVYKPTHRLLRKGVLGNRADLQRIREIWAQLLCVYCRAAGTGTILVPIVLNYKPAFACPACYKKYIEPADKT